MCNKYYEFRKNGLSLIILKDDTVVDEVFYKQCEFIIKQHDLATNYDHIYNLSKLYINIIFKKCKYNSNLMGEIKSRDSI